MAQPPQKTGPGPSRVSGFDPQQTPDTQSIGDAVRYNQELAREVGDVEEAVERLKVRYDQWFMGLERREPAREREELKREVARLKTTFTRNTGLRFRIQSLHARFISYERMWQRCAREKEAGTYRRDLARARRAAAERKAGAAAATPQAGSAPAPEARPGPAAAPPTPTLPPVPGMSEAELRTLHAAWVEAKRSCNEDTARLSVEALARSLAKQVPELLTRTKARTVEFRVAVKDGKTILKAVPRT